MKKSVFLKEIKTGIPDKLPKKKKYNLSINHAPFKNYMLSKNEKN